MLPSSSSTTSVGVCTTFCGNGEILGTPAGRQCPSGSSLLKFPRRSLYRASAQGCKAGCPPMLIKLVGVQTPDISGLPSGILGVGPSGILSLRKVPGAGPTEPNFPV